MNNLSSTISTSYSYPLNSMNSKRVVCTLCPRECKLKEGQRGFCYLRKAQSGKIVLEGYGLTSGIGIDPIEKKPLYHFFPGSKILSFGSIGCNLGCKFCQNWRISKASNSMALAYKSSPTQIVQMAIDKHCPSIAYTYNEPIISLEFVREVAQLASTANIYSVAVTAGLIQPKPREEFFSFIHAANVDLKGFSESFYQKLTGGGQLETVLETLLYIKKETSVWLEITNLIIPGYNDNEKELRAMCEWIFTNLGPQVPVHFSAFHPDFKLQTPKRTSLETLLSTYKIASEVGLQHVYLGNVCSPDGTGTKTFCSKCKKVLIERSGINIKKWITAQGECDHCQCPCAGIFN